MDPGVVLVMLLVALVGLYALYWTIRLAVVHGVRELSDAREITVAIRAAAPD